MKPTLICFLSACSYDTDTRHIAAVVHTLPTHCLPTQQTDEIKYMKPNSCWK